MKTNIASLMNLISEEEKRFNDLTYLLKEHVYNTKTLELDGRENVIEDNKEDFISELEELKSKLKKLDEKIQKNDFEISKLNSEEFEIEL